MKYFLILILIFITFINFNVLATDSYGARYLGHFNEGAKGNDLLMIEIPEGVIAEFELIDEDGTYREFLIPENISNGYGQPKLIDD